MLGGVFAAFCRHDCAYNDVAKHCITQRMAWMGREGLTAMEEEEAIFRPFEQNQHVQVAV